MAFSSVTDPEISVLDYATRYEPPSPEFGAGDPTVFHASESERAAMAARADDQLEDRASRGPLQDALLDPGSVASRLLEYPNKMKELSLLAQLDPVKAASETNKVEKFILTNRADIVKFSSFMRSSDPLMRNVGANAYDALQLKHRREPVVTPDGKQTTVYARTQEASVPADPVSGLGFSDDVTAAFHGDDPYKKQLASLYVVPAMSAAKDPSGDNTIDQKRRAAAFAVDNADRLAAVFGKDGAIRLMSRIPALQGTAGGYTELASAFLDYGEAQAYTAGAGSASERGYDRANRLLTMYEQLTDCMLKSPDRDKSYDDSEKRYAALSVIACMKHMPAVDLSKPAVRNAMRMTASLFARANAYDADLFDITKADGSSVASELGSYISDLSHGIASPGWLNTVDTYFRSLDYRVRGSESSVPRSVDETGDREYYQKSLARLRRQESPHELPDWAAAEAAAVEVRHVLPLIRRTGGFDAAWETLKSDGEALAKFRGDLSEAIRSTMGLLGKDGSAAAGVLADEYISKMGTSQPFLLEQAVTHYLYGKGSNAVPSGVRQALSGWYGYGIVEDARYRDLSRRLMNHLTSPIGGGYTPRQAISLVAETRNRADQFMKAGLSPVAAFQAVLSRGTYYEFDDKQVLDEKTGLPRKLQEEKDGNFKDLPDWRKVVVAKVDAPLPKDFWSDRGKFMSSYKYFDKRYKELQATIQAYRRSNIRAEQRMEEKRAKMLGVGDAGEYYP